MSLQSSLAARPAVTNGITVAVIILAAGFIAFDLLRPRPAPAGPRLFFTTDNGLTYFPDSAYKLPPFDHSGAPAVQAYVYACESGRPFVAYLERLTPQTLDALKKTDAPGVEPLDRDFLIAEGTEVKRPADADWVKRSSDAGEKIILGIKCPDGDSGVPNMVLPED